MPSAGEVLKQILEGQKSILERLDKMDARLDVVEQRDGGDAWLEEEIDLEALDQITAEPPADEPKPEPLTVNEDTGQIDILPPNRKQRKFREMWLPRIALENLPKEWGLTKEKADAAYMAGGPVWLYLTGAGFNEEEKSGRHYILSLPEDVRSCMVDDLNLGEVSQSWIHDFARDILKVDGEGSRVAAETFAEHIDREQTGKGK